MLAVIELAQILAGALDDKFNVINKSAIVQVVTCLEAFNITYESYREVQNTRIIKDLQALRQNKGNDQALAKRIKNLLRKWKEHLASSAQPTASQSSHPNSPQNMSQGSSDTQFMTQHSQSPPISQLRIVNGPTSFTNLLPKSHLGLTRPITSPIIPIPLQNGNQDASKLLGKRKLEIDENENQNRRKVAKESSPVKPFILPNNNNSFIGNIASSMVPIVPAIQTTPPPPIIQPLSVPLLVKAEPPKKRGRKKGSKGIDSTLNGVMPDFQAEIQQKIALSAGKRNKTTLELQQMLELNQNSAMSWTNGDTDSVDRGASNHAIQHNHQHLSQASHLSQLNDHKKVNFNNVKIKKEREESNEANKLQVNNDVLVPSSSITTSSLAAATTNAEEEIARIRSLFPPIDYEAAARDMFDDYNNIDEYGDSVVCTCESREVISYEGDENVDEDLILPPTIKDDVVKNGSNGKSVDESDDDETDDFCAVDEMDDVMLKSPPVQGAVKSIFDPEYDANENLIEEMVRRKPNATKVIEVKVEKEALKSTRIQPIAEAFPNQDNNERVPIVNYVCDEDPMCAARAFFQRDHVQRGQVESLHNSNISCVNGNWNGILTEPPNQDYTEDNEQINYKKHQLWKRVVPKYDFLTCDRIPKTFNDGSPFSIPPPPNGDDVADKAGCEVKSEPFDGFGKSKSDIEFREWHECINVRSYNDEVLTILPYVIID